MIVMRSSNLYYYTIRGLLYFAKAFYSTGRAGGLFTLKRQSKPPLKWWFAHALEGRFTGSAPQGALKV